MNYKKLIALCGIALIAGSTLSSCRKDTPKKDKHTLHSVKGRYVSQYPKLEA